MVGPPTGVDCSQRPPPDSQYCHHGWLVGGPASGTVSEGRRPGRGRPPPPAGRGGGRLLPSRAAAALLVVRSVGGPSPGSVETAAPGIPCPPVDEGCAPLGAPGGYLTGAAGRYQVGLPGDVIVLGRWQCGPVVEPAVLRPRTGEVWTFDAWPTAAQPQVGRLADRVRSARDLRTLPQASGCDRLEVERPGMPPATIFGAGP